MKHWAKHDERQVFRGDNPSCPTPFRSDALHNYTDGGESHMPLHWGHREI